MSDLPSPEALVEMKERCARATPGPWQTRFLYRLFQNARERPGTLLFASDETHDWPDSDFIAAARTDLPAALALIGELLDALHAARAAADSAGWGPVPGSKFAGDAWRSVATALRKGST